MPAFIALATGVANVVSDGLLLMTVVAIPAALRVRNILTRCPRPAREN